jgi:DNA-binding PadR family transcriptional regulator
MEPTTSAGRELTASEVAVLGLLAEAPRSGYEISAVVEERGMREWTDLAPSSVYAILKRLLEAGLIEATTEVVKNRARSRNALTRAGRARLRASVERLLAEVERPTSVLDVGIANVACLPPTRVRELLSGRRRVLEREIARLEATKRERSVGAPYFVRALFERPLAQLRAERRWLTSVIEDVE